MKPLFCLSLFCLLTITGGTQTGFSTIDEAITAGNFTIAQNMIQQKISGEELNPTVIYNLELQAAILDRIRLDFNRDESYIQTTLSKYFPELTAAQIKAWEESNELEMRMIDGEKKYFRNAVWNLFRVNAEAAARREAVDGPRSSSLDQFLIDYLPKVMQALSEETNMSKVPKRLKLSYTLSVKADVVPAGEMIRAWLPYPRSDRDRLKNVELVSTSEENYIVSPVSYPHTSVYMEKKAVAGQTTDFAIELTYEAFDEWHDLLAAEVQPYDTSTELYRTFTSERGQHVLFSAEIKKLVEQIIGTEKDPVQKAWLIYQWIGENIPWASALEYSTMYNIPAYCLANKRGDCGMKGMLFITLCRQAGIPAKWQSGWYLYPDNVNLHDWTELYFEGLGWVPVDPDFNIQNIEGNQEAQRFFFGGADAYRLIVNDDFSGNFYPAKIHPRSETVDFQRGEVEWRGGNLYFDQWRYKMRVEYLD